MKRILILILALIMAASLLTACNNQGNPNESTKDPQASGSSPETNDQGSEVVPAPEFDFFKNDLSQYVTLGEYKGYSFEVEPIKYMDDEHFLRQLNYEIVYYGRYTEVLDRPVTENDIISITFEGYMNGEKFNGGSGTEKLFTMYNGGGFIEGFSDKLIGVVPGNEVTFDIDFPEDYGAEELAGKTATFKVKVNLIYKPDEITDELIKEISGGEMNTAQEFIDATKEIMMKDTEEAYLYMKLELIWDEIIKNTVKHGIPDEILDPFYDYMLSYYQYYANENFMTLDKYLEYYGLTKESLREDTRENLYMDMMVYSLIKAEGITLTDEEYEADLKEFAENSGVTVEEVMYYYTEEDLRDMFYYTRGYEAVINWSTFTVKEATDATPAE